MRRSFLINVTFAITLSSTCSADVVYTVTLNTAPLIGNASAPFALDFQLTSGNTTSGVVNTATLSQFKFGTGGSPATGSPFANSGNASGNLNSTVSLNTSGGSFFNEYSQFFTPGNTLTFLLDLTNQPQPGGTPDEFTFQLIDKSMGEISTTDPSGSNSLIVLDLTGATLSPQTYTTNGDGLSLTPKLSPATPEPGTGYLFTVALAGIALGIRRIKFQSRAWKIFPSR